MRDSQRGEAYRVCSTERVFLITDSSHEITKFQNRLSADAHRTRYPTSEAGEGLGQLCGLSHPLLPAGQAWVGQDLQRAKHPSMKTKAIMISISGIPQASHSQCLVSNLPQMYLIFISSHMKSIHLLELSRPQIDNSNFCSLLFFPPCQVLCKILGFMQGWKKLSIPAAKNGAFCFIRQAQGGARLRSRWPWMLPPWQPSVQSPSGLALSLHMRIEERASQHSYFWKSRLSLIAAHLWWQPTHWTWPWPPDEMRELVKMIYMVSTEHKINLVENQEKLHLFGAN